MPYFADMEIEGNFPKTYVRAELEGEPKSLVPTASSSPMKLPQTLEY